MASRAWFSGCQVALSGKAAAKHEKLGNHLAWHDQVNVFLPLLNDTTQSGHAVCNPSGSKKR
jgi:hypothetical protein